MSDKARNRGECAGGFPIGDLPCALCGATEGDVCGETYAQGLKIVALTSRTEAAEAKCGRLEIMLGATQKLYGDKSEQYLAERRRTDAAEAQVAALRALITKLVAWLDDTKTEARFSYAVLTQNLLPEFRAALSSLPASPATEKLQARVRELEGALGEFTVGASHTRVFLTSREKMHPDGVALYDEAVRRAASALKGEG